MKVELNDLNLEQRFEWLKNNKPPTYIDTFSWSWEQNVETNIKGNMYSFAFNHPYYSGNSGMTDDDARHSLLDDLDVPRAI